MCVIERLDIIRVSERKIMLFFFKEFDASELQIVLHMLLNSFQI